MRILVLQAAGLRLGYLGCYGCEWVPTPHLDRLAAEGVVFDQHIADQPQLCPSQRSAWTGRYGFAQQGSLANALAPLLKGGGIQHRFLTIEDWDQLDKTPWLDLLARHDPCLVWIDLPSLAPPWQIAEDFLTPFFPEPAEDEEPIQPWLKPPSGLADDVDHERLQNTYAAVVTQFDAHIGSLLHTLQGRGIVDGIMLMLTAESGLALGEHGVVGEARAWLHEELVHVPLLVRLPRAADAGRRIAALTQPVDLFPTLLDALGLPAPVTQGCDLLPLLRGETGTIRAYACSHLTVGASVEWLLRTRAWALLLPQQVPEGDPPRPPQLFVKPDDRCEVNDVRQHHLELAEGLERTLQAFADDARGGGPFAPPPLPG